MCCINCVHRRTGTFGLGGVGGGGGGVVGDLMARKKITKCPKASVVYTYSNRSKNSLMKLLSFRKHSGIEMFWNLKGN